ncbi:MAG: AAA family ATPase [Candidatus Kapabacteria bacterium]|nr:AAA family ATPase [Candidatus Kapabacteria bacterium]
METPQITPAVYFQSLTIENVRCFKGERTIDLSDGNGKPAMWTVILGNNNTGKTTLLRCLYGLLPVPSQRYREQIVYYPIGYDYHPFSFISNGYLREYGFSFKVVASMLEQSEDNLFRPKSFRNEDFNDSDEFKENEWGLINYNLGGTATGVLPKGIELFEIWTYNINRHSGNSQASEERRHKMPQDVFSSVVALSDAEEWLLQTYLASKNGVAEAKKYFDKICDILTEILPDVKKFTVNSNERKFTNYVVAHTDFGEIPLHDLGYGYQSITAWIVDLAKRMVERYPESENPLREPAMVLVDELDLHLHPEWQRTIISFLSKHFPRTQFIVTTHSPLIVQSFEKVNLVVLHKNEEDDSVEMQQYVQQSFQGWTVEEILRDVMRMGERIYSNEYLQTRRDFDAALDNDDYAEAKRLRDKLKQMMNESNPIARVLDMQVAALNGVTND